MRSAPVLLGLLVLSAVGMPNSAPAQPPQGAARRSADVVVLGGTPAGIVAAVAAAREGRSVILINSTSHLGGVVSGGLTASDVGRDWTIGGYAREFFNRILAYYQWKYGPDSVQVRQCRNGYWFEPHVAELVFNWMVQAEKNIALFLNQQFATALVERGRIAALVTQGPDGALSVFEGRIFVDATYEGDLMASAGVPYRVGREGAYEYGEEHAPPEPDGKVQAYNFRLCLTDDPQNRLPWEKPEGYDPSRYDLLARWLSEHPDAKMNIVFGPVRMPNRKMDLNNNGRPYMSTDLVGGSWNYCRATIPERQKIAREHELYIRGLMYFITHDPRVPQALREEVSRWGLAKDEFVDNNNWPYQLYVREARRMVGMYVFTEHDATTNRQKPDSIGLGSYALDSHYVDRYIDDQGNVHNLGWLFIPIEPYEIPYGVIVPQKLPNLLVPVCCSATHVGYCTLRMEPVYMILGHAAGVAASIALERDLPVQNVPIAELQRRLVEQGQLIRLDLPPTADFIFYPSANIKPGQQVLFLDRSTDDHAIVSWEWDFDSDGLVDSTEPNPKHAFALNRTYRVTLTVTDSRGQRSKPKVVSIPVGDLSDEGSDIILDDTEAQLVGRWVSSTSVRPWLGEAYLHDDNEGKGKKSARYTFTVPRDGTYSLAILYSAHENRATNVPVTITFPGGKKTVPVNQRRPAQAGFFVLGQFALRKGDRLVVEISNAGTDGYVIADAVRLSLVKR